MFTFVFLLLNSCIAVTFATIFYKFLDKNKSHSKILGIYFLILYIHMYSLNTGFQFICCLIE